MRIFLNKYCNFQAKTDDCKGDMPFRATSCRITYLCRKDMLGNIIALIDNTGNTVVQYNYDAWGNHKVVDANGNEVTSSTHIGNLNPFRYRGYYYDVETGFYFLKSRYYDPEVGRFLNMDSIIFADNCETNGINLYAYCLNNPVNYIDPFGKFVILSTTAAIGLLCAGLFAIFVSPIVVDAAGDLAESIVDSVESINIPDVSNVPDIADINVDNDSAIDDDLPVQSEAKQSIISSYTFDQILSKQKYKPKRRAARIRAKSKKDAEERARRRGGGRTPRFHKGKFNKDGKWVGPHFHPNVNKNSPYYHDHYFYIIMLLLFGDWENDKYSN